MPPVFRRNFQSAVLFALASPSSYFYGTFTLYGALFQGTSRYDGRVDDSTTSTCAFTHVFGSPCSVFDRLYSRNHDCSLFLCLLRCFNSAGYLSRREWACAQEVSLGHLRFNGSLRLPGVISRLGTTFIGSRAERSPIWFVATQLNSIILRNRLRLSA